MKRRRVLSFLAPARGFYRAGGAFVLGLALFILGAALSFQVLILPTLRRIDTGTRHLALRIIPAAQIDFSVHILGGVLLLVGLYLAFRGLRSGFLHLMETLNPSLSNEKVGEVYIRKQKLAQGPRIVALGGGTGLSNLLRGLKNYSSNITAIVTVADDGGSSGRIKKEMGMIPPGDIRNCLAALADAEKAMTDLFQFRFKEEAGTLSGHSVGNLLIAALVNQAEGDFEKAVETAAKVLSIRGRVMPAALHAVELNAVLADGQHIKGESVIGHAPAPIRQVSLDPPDVEANRAAIEAIEKAELICIGPGSVFTSIIPNLLVPGIVEAIRRSKAVKVYICNVMTQPGESDSFTASEHVTAVQIHAKARVFDYILLNSAVPSPHLLERYNESGQFFVEPDVDRIRAMGFKVIQGEFISDTDVVRHDSLRVAATLIKLVQRK